MNSNLREVLLSFIFIIFLFCGANGQPSRQYDKVCGMSYVGPETHNTLDNTFKEIKSRNVNWVAIIPEAIVNRTSLEIRDDKQNHWWGFTKDGSIEAIKSAKLEGLKVMLKPQVVLDNVEYHGGVSNKNITLLNFGNKVAIDNTNKASWRGEINFNSESKWRIWETSYRAYILDLACLAQELDVDLFCIGTELKESTKRRSKFWRNLIVEVRKFYDGPITYSANWDEYERITFWEYLDVIGMNTYFPISEEKTPDIMETCKRWNEIAVNMKKISKRTGKHILITEFGYRNVSYAGRKPWIHDKGQDVSNMNAQVNLYESFFLSLWHYDWIAGGFSWNWEEELYDPNNTDFSVRDKPAEDVLKKWYKKSLLKSSLVE